MLSYTTPASNLKTLADSLKDILTECWFQFEKDHITMVNVDPEKVIAVQYFQRPPVLTYVCSEPFTFPFYIQTLYRVLRGVRSNDEAKLWCSGTSMPLTISIFSSTGVMKNTITIAPLNITPSQYIKPHLQYDVEVNIESQQFYHILHDLSAISRKLRIKMLGNTIEFMGSDECGTTSSFEQSFPQLANQVFDATYLLKYLEKFAKPAVSPHLTLKLQRDQPLSVVYHLENGFLEMTIAPLV